MTEAPPTSSGSVRAPSSDDPRVDELRHQLRSLGYLDAGVDRFVLAPAVRSRRPATIALLASLRSGIIAAALLGPAAAVGLAARLPGLVTGVRDAIVIAVYMAVLFGAAVTVLSFLAALAVSAIARSSASPQRGRTLSTAAGVIAAVACLVYLTLWWRTANAGFGWDAPVWTAFALVVAVAISLLVGHVITLTARAVVVARTAADARHARVPDLSWKLAAVVGVMAFGGAALLLVATADTGAVETPISFTVRSTGARVTVVAIDGFDLDFTGLVRGDRPSLQSVLRRVHAALAPADSRDPARVWTTIATGRRPEVHGIERLETRRVAGVDGRLPAAGVGRLLGGATDLLRLTRPAIASNVERRVKTFWEVAAQAGLRTGVVNWWATWPADPRAGIVLSDRAILRLEHGGTVHAEIAPAEVYERLHTVWPGLRRRARQRVESLFAGTAGFATLPEEIQTVLTRSAELDATVLSLAEAIGADLDLLVIYLPGLDIAQHTLFGTETPAPSAVPERLSALQHYYYVLELLLGPYLRQAASTPDHPLFVITQPGRLHQGRGILALVDKQLQTGAQASGTAVDVAPTILNMLGVPIAKDLDGRVLERLFPEHFRDRFPVRFIDTYGLKRTAPTTGGGSPLDAEAIERLRSLGYVR